MEDLEDSQYFDKDALTNTYPLDCGENSSNDEGKEYVAEGGDKSNNNSHPPVHVDIPEYQVQKLMLISSRTILQN